MRKISIILITLSIMASAITVNAAPVPRESAPCKATNEAIIVVENFIGDILTEVQNGLGYADARTKSNRIFFNAWLNGQTNGYSYGELVNIANNAIWQYRDMYLRPEFYANNLEKVRAIIAPVIEDYKSGRLTYGEAELNARVKIYQSVNPNFNPDVECMKDPIYRDIQSVDNSLFILDTLFPPFKSKVIVNFVFGSFSISVSFLVVWQREHSSCFNPASSSVGSFVVFHS